MGNALGTPPSGPRSLSRGEKKSEPEESPRRNFTLKELSAFDGTRGSPIYIALKSEVYDVSASRDLYGPGGEYHVLAGKDASRALATSTLTEEAADRVDLSDLEGELLEVLEDWVKRFRDERQYPSIGRLLIPMDLTLDELRKYNGVDNLRGTVLVCINGTIYDVTSNGFMHYGPEGAYSQFAGRDASRALACMSLDEECLDNPSVDDLSDVQLSSLTDWETKFQQKYTPVGKLLT